MVVKRGWWVVKVVGNDGSGCSVLMEGMGGGWIDGGGWWW